MILDLGCGTAKVAGAIGMDNVSLPGVDVVHDLLDLPYPFDDGSAEEIYLNHVIEHFTLADGQKILGEAYRILCQGGIVHVRVPHVFTVAAWADPTHKSAFTFLTGQFFQIDSAKSYYKETASIWELAKTSSRVTWFNWKRYRLRIVDTWLSALIARWLNWLLGMPNWPGAADLMVKSIPLFFVEIQWDLRKPTKV
jgi:SAM-dependent methyltransferase